MKDDTNYVQVNKAQPYQAHPAKSGKPTPFMGAAGIVLKTGGAVLGLIAKAIRGSVSLLKPRSVRPRANEPRKMGDARATVTITDVNNHVVRP